MIRTSRLTIDQLVRLAEQGTLFALLDACDEPSIPVRCREMPADRAMCLYQGQGLREFWHVAPYLFRLTPADLDWVRRKLWDRHWGYFVMSRSTIVYLRTHFRQFLTVQGPGGETMLYRFYDPRVIRRVLVTGSMDQAASFYGPVKGLAFTSPSDFAGVELFVPGP